METFIDAKDFVFSAKYDDQRKKALRKLHIAEIDSPIKSIITNINILPYCFTLQCCYGHFIYEPDQDPHNLDRLPEEVGGLVTYRIAYLALCMDNNDHGRDLLQKLAQIPELDPGYIQFGSAAWFWRRQPNSYVLQVEPDRYKHQDQTELTPKEAFHVEVVRDGFFNKLAEIFT